MSWRGPQLLGFLWIRLRLNPTHQALITSASIASHRTRLQAFAPTAWECEAGERIEGREREPGSSGLKSIVLSVGLFSTKQEPLATARRVGAICSASSRLPCLRSAPRWLCVSPLLHTANGVGKRDSMEDHYPSLF